MPIKTQIELAQCGVILTSCLFNEICVIPLCIVFSLSKMEKDHSQAINEHKTVVKQLNKKTDSSMESMKQQHTAAISKVQSLRNTVKKNIARRGDKQGVECESSTRRAQRSRQTRGRGIFVSRVLRLKNRLKK